MDTIITRPSTFVVIPVRCIICKCETNIDLNITKYFAWRGGHGSIQKMLPELTDVERELLITGLCEKHQ